MNTMNSLSWVFLSALGLGLLLQLWLSLRQAGTVQRRRDAVPVAFRDRIALADHRRAAAYSLDRLRLERIELLLGAVLALAWTFGGGIEWLHGLWSATGLAAPWAGVGLLVAMLLISALIELPLGLWSTFGIEARHGFNRATPAGHARDLLLQTLLLTLLGTPILALVLWLMRWSGEHWWLPAWCAWMGFTLVIAWLYPRVLAPLFNQFRPLEDAALRSRLDALLARSGFRSDGMFVMDGSRRSSHGNAYFTGFGKNKRIVFFDTLLDSLEPGEIEAVLAHELGHFHHRHVLKGLALMATTSLLALLALAWLAEQPWFFAGLGVRTVAPETALALFLLVGPVFLQFLSPLFAALSRRHEFEADAFAARQADAGALIAALVKMTRDNASTLTPDPLYSAFHHSHPPAPIRIARLAAASSH